MCSLVLLVGIYARTDGGSDGNIIAGSLIEMSFPWEEIIAFISSVLHYVQKRG